MEQYYKVLPYFYLLQNKNGSSLLRSILTAVYAAMSLFTLHYWIAWFLPRFFFSVLLPTQFWFLAVVASGLLSWGHFISSDITDLIAQILFKLNDDITEFNTEMPLTEKWAFNLVNLHY